MSGSSPSKEQPPSAKQNYDASQFFGFNYPFTFNSPGSGPADLFFGNQIPDDLFQFVTDPLQSTTASYPPIVDSTTTPSGPSMNTLSQQQQQRQQQPHQQLQSDNNMSSSPPPVPKQSTNSTPLMSQQNTSTSQQQQPQKPLASTPFNHQEAAISAGKKRKHDQIMNEPINQTVFTVIVGGKTFRLSWESLKSDGPNNFFVNYFRNQRNTRVMYVDRDADIFQLIVHHLRGYYVRPINDTQNQDLMNDARYYGLQRLHKTLQEFLFVNVGGRVFRLSWDLLRKDGKNNFFTGPLMHSLFNPHGGREQGAPVYIDRDPDNFADIVNHLRGYTIHIKDEMHRKNLLKDAQYYVFRQLVEKLMTARKTVDGFGEEGSPEVLLLLQDVRIINLLPTKQQQQLQQQQQQLQQQQKQEEQQQKNRSPIASPSTTATSFVQQNWNMTQLQYKREGLAHALLVQVADICIQVHYPQNQNQFSIQQQGGSMQQITMEMNDTDRTKLNIINQAVKGATTGIQDRTLYLDDACALTVDDQHIASLSELADHHAMEPCTKCVNQPCRMLKLILLRGICGLHLLDNNTLTLCAVRLETISSRLQLNLKREFLPAS
ncbi:hypothetical protein BCR42DRAFT_448571 [Absidia repens]|uniref:BTB domain-containing protein n=1 Tax=Absidia repens TaxID=90262 RepID=A0A1X2IPP9_9FUNG|nr:hypothetical protein BCR42DRAFT_448571 [Absidia repens]